MSELRKDNVYPAMNLINRTVEAFGDGVPVSHENLQFLICLWTKTNGGVVPVFDHICKNKRILTIAFRRCVISVFFVLFDVMRIPAAYFIEGTGRMGGDNAEL